MNASLFLWWAVDTQSKKQINERNDLRTFLVNLVVCVSVYASPLSSYAKIEKYQVDPNHTYPSFEADHLGGLSKWRGKINETEGFIVFDNQSFTGAVEIKMNMDSIDFGNEKMNRRAKKKDLFHVEKFPYAFYSGPITFEDETPKEITGILTLRGISKPVSYTHLTLPTIYSV